jgi:defect-in-organelle-trafficking protein DotC
MKLNKIASILIILSISSLNVYSSQESTGDGKKDIKKILENNSELNDKNFLIEYYKEKSKNGRIQIEDSFDIKEPLTMDDLAKLNHSYLQKKIKLLEEKGLDALADEMSNGNFKKLREDSVYNEAIKVGIQSALYKVLFEFKKSLGKIEIDFKKLFDFNELMLANGLVKPPVILESSSKINKESDHKLRTSYSSYLIYSQAEVALRAPSYIDYLNFEPIKPKTPETLLLPTTSEERKLWRDGIQEGWILGLRQGNLIIKEGLASLIRDFVGMHRFHLMFDSGIISMPSIEKIEIGTTTDGTNLNIGESTFKIAILPEFNSNTQLWMALPRIEDFLDKEF